MKNEPEKFGQYLSLFKKSTFKKMLKDSLSPDLISFMLMTLKDYVSSTQIKAKALRGMSLSSNFQLTYSILPESDMECIRGIFDMLECDLTFDRQELMELCEAYAIKL